MLNGSPVNVGDTVYILGIGTGRVVGTDESGGFSVQAGGRGTLYYRDGGMVGNARRVYWHDPVFIDPPKDLNLWTAFMDSWFYTAYCWLFWPIPWQKNPCWCCASFRGLITGFAAGVLLGALL